MLDIRSVAPPLIWLYMYHATNGTIAVSNHSSLGFANVIILCCYLPVFARATYGNGFLFVHLVACLVLLALNSLQQLVGLLLTHSGLLTILRLRFLALGILLLVVLFVVLVVPLRLLVFVLLVAIVVAVFILVLVLVVVIALMIYFS